MDHERWAKYWAGRYGWALENRNDIDREDLVQAALVGDLIAQRKYEPGKCAFTTFSAYYIRREIRNLIGIKQGRLPPQIESLDEPISEDTEDTKLDMLEDKTLPDMADEVIDRERREGVQAALGRLTDQQQREALRLCYLEGKGAKKTAEALGVSQAEVLRLFDKGKRALHKDRILQKLADVEMNYYITVGVKTFKSTHISAVEAAVLSYETQREGLLNKLKAIEQETQEAH